MKWPRVCRSSERPFGGLCRADDRSVIFGGLVWSLQEVLSFSDGSLWLSMVWLLVN